jgi:hypothetical protein
MRRGWVALLGMALVVATGCSPVHRPRVTAQVAPATGDAEDGIASWYGPGFHGKRTSSGERYDQYDLTAAHRTLPLGTWVVVTNRLNGRSVRVYVNDRGPYVDGRLIDLSYGAAHAIGMVGSGTVPVRIVVLGSEPPSEPQSVLFGERLAAGPAPSWARCWAQPGADPGLVRHGRVNDDLVAAVTARLEVARHLRLKHPVPTRALGPAEIAAAVDADLQRTFPAGDRARTEATYEFVGLVPSGTRLEPAMERMLTTQLAAFYDPHAKVLVIAKQAVGGRGAGLRLFTTVTGRDLVGELVLSHELTHSLQDQYWGLPTASEPATASDTDRLPARRALLEGDATWASFATVSGGTRRRDLGTRAAADERPPMRSSPRAPPRRAVSSSAMRLRSSTERHDLRGPAARTWRLDAVDWRAGRPGADGAGPPS